MKWEEVEVFYPALSPYSAFDLNQAGSLRRSPQRSSQKEEGAALLQSKAAIEASVLLRSGGS
jgi:hypothetical protein